MQGKPIDWPMWISLRGADLRSTGKMLSAPDREGYSRCQLCDQRVPGWKREEHHRLHMVELDARQANAGDDRRVEDSSRRVENRREQRRRELEQARAFGKDPYLEAVTKVEQLSGDRVRPLTRRRIRHPRGETVARVKELLEQGRMPSAIADELRLSLDYTRRIIRGLDKGPK